MKDASNAGAWGAKIIGHGGGGSRGSRVTEKTKEKVKKNCLIDD